MFHQEVIQTQSRTLPLPRRILASQAPPAPCLACSKVDCALQSHKYYSDAILKTPKGKHKIPGRKTVVTKAFLGQKQEVIRDHLVQYPIVMNTEQKRLLALWSHGWAVANHGPERHLFPIRFIDRILPIAITHAPLFQSLLTYSATIWSIANHATDDVAPRQLQSAAHLLSQACPTEQAASADESMLTAIFIMLVYLALGNAYEVERHMSGLVHLATLRGGPHYLGLSGIVAEALMYTDHLQALYFDREPVWKLPLPALDLGVTPRMGQGFQRLMTTNDLAPDVFLAANSLSRTADIFEQATTTTPVPTEAMNAFGYLSAISEYQLARCNAIYHHSSSRTEWVCLALILFNLLILRNDGAITPGIRKIEYRFWTALEAVEARNSLQDIPPCLLLWMLITALTASIRGDCQWRPLAMERMRAASTSAALESWDHFQTNVLDAYLWLRPSQEESVKRVWLEIEGSKTAAKHAKT